MSNNWVNNPFVVFGAVVGVALAVPVVFAIAPPAIAGLGGIVAATTLTAVGVGVIGLATYVGKEFDDFREANDSHIKIKQILDNTGTDDKKLTAIKTTLSTANKINNNNLFSKLLNQDKASKEVSELYLGVLDPNREAGEEGENTKILEGLKIVNGLDKKSKTNPADFLRDLKEFKKNNGQNPYSEFTTREVGQKIAEDPDIIKGEFKSFYSHPDDERSSVDSDGPALYKFALYTGTPAILKLVTSPFFANTFAGPAAAAAAAAPAAAADADADARKIKISGDFFTDDLSPEKLSSVMYQYKLIMGLNILESTKSEDDKIKELKKLMQIRLDVQSNPNNKIESVLKCIDEFTKIDANAPTDDIPKDTAWPKALRVFAQAILEDTTDGITDKVRLLALKSYLDELKNSNELVTQIQNLSQAHLKENIINWDAQHFLKSFKGSDKHRYFTQDTLDSIKPILPGIAATAGAGDTGTAAAGGDVLRSPGRAPAPVVVGGGADGLGRTPATRS